MGSWEVIWFINDAVRFALLHPRAVCSYWLPLNCAQPWSYKLQPGKFLEQSPSAVSPSYRSFFIRVIIRALVWKEAWEWDYGNGNLDFIGLNHATVRKTQPHAEEMYCKFQSNQTCSKLPAWLSEQQVKGWNCMPFMDRNVFMTSTPTTGNTGNTSFPLQKTGCCTS